MMINSARVSSVRTSLQLTLSLVFIASTGSVTANSQGPGTVFQAPRLVPEMIGQATVGVRAEGSLTDTVDFSTTSQRTFSANDSLTITHGSSSAINYTDTVTSKPVPNGGSFLGDIVGGIATGNPTKFLQDFSNAIDYSTQPTNDDWKRIYTLNTTDAVNQSSSTSLTQSFIQQVQQHTTSTVKYDVNGGYVQLAIRLTNHGSGAVTIRNPMFAVYFVSAGGQLQQIGISRAYQDKALSTEDFYLAPGGGHTDLTLSIDGIDYKTLANEYASAVGLTLVMESPQAVQNAATVPLASEFTAQAAQGVHVRVTSDSYSIDAYVATPAAGVRFAELMNAVGIQVAIADHPAKPAFLVAAVGPDHNNGAESDPSSLRGQQLIDWRKWIVFAQDQYYVSSPIDTAAQICPGNSIYLVQLTAKDILGSAYRPVIYSAQGVSLEDGKNTILAQVQLQNGDQVVLSNVNLIAAYRDTITYQRNHVYNNAVVQPGVIPWPAGLSTGVLQSLPVVPTPTIQPLSPGHPFIFYQPASIRKTQITSMREYFQVGNNYPFPADFPWEELLTNMYTGGHLFTFKPVNSTHGGFATDWPTIASADWSDRQKVLAAIKNSRFVFDIAAADAGASVTWHFDAPPIGYGDFFLYDPTAPLSPTPNNAPMPSQDFDSHYPGLFLSQMGGVTITNYGRLCPASNTLPSGDLCSRSIQWIPEYTMGANTGPRMLQPWITSQIGNFKFTADVEVVRTQAR